ncbi:hypothetical protein [Saccharothrix sp. ST-888]|uniref:hypothetical protein n=1 Tax=Saccharothrix sp. ST-888 TaxID=1427391 RepID=UPI0012E019FF|nr:hypothetical protein [Saccharothrix sp. ST-888]
MLIDRLSVCWVERRHTPPNLRRCLFERHKLRAPANDPDVIPLPAQRIQRHDILGGLIYEYRNAA